MAKQNWKMLLETTIPSDWVAGRQVMENLLVKLEAIDWIQDELFGIHLAVEEALVNAIRHGNREDVTKQVTFSCQLATDCLRVEITDEGKGFNPDAVPDPTKDENLEVPSGRGVMLMRSFMTHVNYHDCGNRVVMEKTRGVNGTQLDVT